MSLQPVLASGTSLCSTVIVLSPLVQSTSVPDTNSDPQSPPHMVAIIGGAIGAVTLLALLIFIAIWYRRKRRLSGTLFTLPSTARTAQIGSEVWLKSQSIGDDIRPSSREDHCPFNIPTHTLWSILATDARPLLQIPYHLT
ncbi:hypothetical protein BDR05DRAFT_1063656 [Suillus weaverae]|nr:hypothetical protein BDR05DRAFT_1063656 [Suillus weaverae]